MKVAFAMLSGVLFLAGSSVPSNPELSQAEKLLSDHAIGVDGPALLRYLSRQVLTPTDRDRVLKRIHELGDDNFRVRQEASADIIRVGAPALPILKKALTDPDLERALRTRQCLETIEAANEEEVVQAAVRVLAERRPPGSVAAVMAYLSDCTDETTVWKIRLALVKLARQDDKVDPALLQALNHKAPACRAAAAFAVARSAPTELPRLRPLLRDANPEVRFEAALALAASGDRQGVPVLITLLEEPSSPLIWQVHELLLNIAGDKAPSFTLPEEPDTRRNVCTAWATWWRENGDKADLTALRAERLPPGETMIMELSLMNPGVGTVWACRADGKVRWSWSAPQNPVDVDMLPGGRVLIADFAGNQIVERDRKGKVLWTFKAAAPPVSCQRLPNGNTFLATTLAMQEVNPEGMIVKQFPAPQGTNIWHARRTRDGHMYFLNQMNQIVELDATGSKVRTFNLGLSSAGGGFFEILPNGNLLVSLCAANLVFEIDEKGKRSHEIQVAMPAGATRLPNGHTLVASIISRQVQEYDAADRVVWQRMSEGQIMVARRY
jgi:HEAT repeat protein